MFLVCEGSNGHLVQQSFNNAQLFTMPTPARLWPCTGVQAPGTLVPGACTPVHGHNLAGVGIVNNWPMSAPKIGR